MWVVTKRIDDFNQYGEYMVAAFEKKPSFGELKVLLPEYSHSEIERLLKKGKTDGGSEWFYLVELGHGELNDQRKRI